jgi:Protein of unknown function (DUF1264)
MRPSNLTSITIAILLLSVGIFAYANASNRADAGVPNSAAGIECGVPEADGPRVNGPIGAIHAHLCGFHFYNGDMSRQVRADHYCSHLNADVWQCIIYESDKTNARLVGVEYIISGKLFDGLPPDEKKLWHSHRYEVMSGQLVAPGMTEAAEGQLMRDFVTTYGKTWYLWQVDRGDQLPLGLPKLVMGFTSDGQADPKMVSRRDQEFHMDSTELRARRAEFKTNPIAAGADAWQHGLDFQIDDAQLTESSTPAPAARMQ